MERGVISPSIRASTGATLMVAGMLLLGVADAAPPDDSSAPADRHSLQEVEVTALKLDRRTLNRVAMQFARSHAEVNPIVHQIGRWQRNVCPSVTGLRPAASAFVSARVREVARSVGAPTREGDQCGAASVDIVFSSEPQQLLDRIAKAYPSLLGSNRSSEDMVFRRAIQSWYITGTRVMNGWSPPIGGEASAMALQMGIDASTPPGAIAHDGARVDPAYGEGFAGVGLPGSYFTKGLMSEILQVLVIVDTRRVSQDSLASISDYIAMLTLTRMKMLDGCDTLPSIVDLLSSGCAEREKPASLTATDRAYLRALYSSDLEKNLNLEQGDIRDRMVTAITGR